MSRGAALRAKVSPKPTTPSKVHMLSDGKTDQNSAYDVLRPRAPMNIPILDAALCKATPASMTIAPISRVGRLPRLSAE